MIRFGVRYTVSGAARSWGATSASATRFSAAKRWFSAATRPRLSSATATPTAAGATSDVAAWVAPAHNRSVANWLYISAAMVGGVVWFGGVTRLTESGLSIVDWKPISGIRPPLSQKEWEDEFANYQQYPEFKQKSDMTLTQFKFIFFWEWAHRVLARSLGVVFGVPLVYYCSRHRFRGNRAFFWGLMAILGLGCGQGFMGWYMVRSGLDNKLLEERKKATVSAYRLASHLFLAFTIYSLMLRMGYSLTLPKAVEFARRKKAQFWARTSFYTMFATAMSGAFVAGLDAGLLYNDGFPLMQGGVIPPISDLTALTPAWRNLFENHATVQTIHRLMAGATFVAVMGLNVACSRRRCVIPPVAWRTMLYVNAALVTQVALGMWTILSTVDIPVAASHQVVALVFLATLLRMMAVVGNRGIILA